MHSVSPLSRDSCSRHHGINFFYVVEKTLVICGWYNGWIVLGDILGIVVVWKVILAFHAIVKEITSAELTKRVSANVANAVGSKAEGRRHRSAP